MNSHFKRYLKNNYLLIFILLSTTLFFTLFFVFFKKNTSIINKYDFIYINEKDNFNDIIAKLEPYLISTNTFITAANLKKYSKNFKSGKFKLQDKLNNNNLIDILRGESMTVNVTFNNQEKMSYRIIYCEIVCALAIQIEGGNFVCKIFDIHTEFTAKLLYILLNHYTTVHICKPKTSRPANSEKYIICKNFKGINSSFLRQLMDLVDKWDKTTNKLNFITMDNNFIKQIYNFNELITKSQTENIKQTLEIIANYDNIELTSGIIENQKVKALSWCNMYNIDVNEQSSFLC